MTSFFSEKKAKQRRLDSFINIFISKSERDQIRYLNIEDFLLGGHITIFHRRFFLYDCDECTKKLFKVKFGRCPYPLMNVDDQRQCQTSIRFPSISKDRICRTCSNW